MSGYLFYWVVIGVDPTPRPIPPLGKLGMVFASLPLHAFFGVVLMGPVRCWGTVSTDHSNCPGTLIFWVINSLVAASRGQRARFPWWS
jgi:cytochrome c oxidase assembly factor CtaG